MTRKDFELIANAIHNSPLSDYDRGLVGGSLAAAIAETHPRFDPSLFIDACRHGA